MRNNSTRHSFVLTATFLACSHLACGSSNSDSRGSGGSFAASGGTGSDGETTSSGATHAGGAVSTGGRPSEGSGGMAPLGSGGATSGSGGSYDSGGSYGAGGSNDAGGSSGATDGSGGAPMDYQPCPPSEPCKILPLGDSITWGVGDEDNAGYRGPLFVHIVTNEKQATFTGSLMNGASMISSRPFPQKNEGHSGWGIARVTSYSDGHAGIAERIPSPAFDETSGGVPDIVLLHIGTNDQGMYTADQMAGDLGTLLDKIVLGAPDALIVVAQIIPLGYGNNQVIKDYNSKIPPLVQERVAKGQHLVILDMFSGFDAQSMLGSDSIHPNSAGYQLMADRWYSVIGPMLP